MENKIFLRGYGLILYPLIFQGGESVTITGYINNSDKRVIGKDLTLKETYNAVLKDGCSIINPILILSKNSTIVTVNYIYIPDFERYYFVNNIIILDGNRVELDCHVDVLESFKTEILGLSCIIKRNTNVFNMYLDDPLFKSLVKQDQQIKAFPSTQFYPQNLLSGSECFVLTVAGG